MICLSKPLRGALVAIGVFLVAPHIATGQEAFSGHVTRIFDGDTLAIGPIRVRLWGIDAPEHHEPGGRAAREFLELVALGQHVKCLRLGVSYERIVARCERTVDGRDLGAILIDAGHADEWLRFSDGYYSR